MESWSLEVIMFLYDIAIIPLLNIKVNYNLNPRSQCSFHYIFKKMLISKVGAQTYLVSFFRRQRGITILIIIEIYCQLFHTFIYL